MAKVLPLLFGIMCLVVSESSAQSAQLFSVQGSGLYEGLSYSEVDDGLGFEAQVRYTPSAWSFGAGFQYTSHSVTTGNGRINLYGGFLEPRYSLDVGSSNVAPYLSGRLSLSKLSANTTRLSGSTNGVSLNGGGGLLIRVGPRLNLDLGATYGYTDWNGDIGSASNLIGRVGLAVGIGG